MADRYEMRAADSDRERIAEILRDAHGEGRLTQDELLARVEATYGARTYRELDRLIADLPMPRRPAAALARPMSAPTPQRRGVMRRAARGSLNVAWWFYGVAVAVNLMIWLLISVTNGALEYFWPIWVAGPWGVMLAAGELAYRSRE